MSVQRSIHIDAELSSVGQFDRTERWRGKLEVTQEADGRVRIGQPTQSGFEAITIDWNDLTEAVRALDGRLDAT